jgi:hypothetical protein
MIPYADCCQRHTPKSLFTTVLLQQVQRRAEKTQGREEKKDGTSQFLPGTPIVTVTIGHPMLFEVYAQVEDDKK